MNKKYWFASFLWMSLSLAGAELKYSGTLGQSQSPEQPLTFLESRGIACFEENQFWSMDDNFIFRFTPKTDGTIELTGKYKNEYFSYQPLSILLSDGKQLFFRGKNDAVYTIDPTASDIEIKKCFNFPVGKKIVCWNLMPDASHAGFALKGKFFIHTGEAISAFDQDGNNMGVVFQLPKPPEGAKWSFQSFGFEPESGDVLLASNWPDYRVYRYDVTGKQITQGGWPRKGITTGLVCSRNRAWSLFNRALELPPEIFKSDEARQIQSTNTASSPKGLAESADGQMIAISDTQGILLFDEKANPLNLRIGGLPNITRLAIDPAGTIIAIHQDTRVIRLWLDDLPAAAFSCGSNEPWQVGGNWSGAAAGIAANGEGEWIVLDKQAGKLWAFRPEYQKELSKAWRALCADKTFQSPRSLSLSDKNCFVLDGDKIFVMPKTDFNSRRELVIGVANLRHIAATDDNHLVAATADSVMMFAVNPNGSCQKQFEYSTKTGNITGLVADQDKIVLTDAQYLNCQVLNASDGTLEATVDYQKIPGGLNPRAVALLGKFIIISDSSAKRLVRLQITR